MPLRDWQFWVVTLAAVAGLAAIARALVPRPPKRSRTRTTLTVSARRAAAPDQRGGDDGQGSNA